MHTIDREKLKKLHRVSYVRGVWAILVEWLGIACAVTIAEASHLFSLKILALFFIAGRMHALAFMVHEGVHFLITRKKGLNDWTINLLTAWPLYMHVQSYRQNHLAHHEFINSDQDPDWARKQDGEWETPIAPRRMAWLFFKSFLGIYTFRTFKAVSGIDAAERKLILKKRVPFGLQMGRVLFYLSLLTVLTVFGLWKIYLFYWVLPLATWLQALNRLRKLAEHFGVYGRPREVTTRTVIPHWWEKIFVAPKNIYFHNEHHYYVGVPYYFLPQLHTLVMGDPVLRKECHVSRGYFQVLRECMGPAESKKAPSLAT